MVEPCRSRLNPAVTWEPNWAPVTVVVVVTRDPLVIVPGVQDLAPENCGRDSANVLTPAGMDSGAPAVEPCQEFPTDVTPTEV